MVPVAAGSPSDHGANICSLMRRTEDEFEAVQRLARAGLSDYRIASLTGISRATVQRWRHRVRPPTGRIRAADVVDWQVTHGGAYCYLLGCYLGDGHLAHRSPNGWTMRIACDRRYEEIIDEIQAAIALTFPGRRATRFQASTGASDVLTISHPAIGLAFPHHGAGPKHLRRIALADWQRTLTRAHPAALIRGLIHSDGCRVINRFRTKLPSGRVASYSYVRYFFSNLSDDIRAIFIEHCELLDIRVTQSNPRNLSVSHRASTAILDAIVGPKC